MTEEQKELEIKEELEPQVGEVNAAEAGVIEEQSEVDTEESVENTGPELLNVLLYPDPFLRRVAEPVGELTEDIIEDLKQKSAAMLVTMHSQNGVGLAATQVGFKERLFVMNTTGKPEDDFVLINPEIVEKSGHESGVEGCLSFPGVIAKVKRHKKITIKATALDGNVHELTIDGGLVSRCIQHELEHLDGILFIDKVSPAVKLKIKKPLKALKAYYKAVTAIKKEMKDAPVEVVTN